MKITSELTSPTWWKDATRRVLYTVIAVALPYFGASLLVDVPWALIGSVAGLAAIEHGEELEHALAHADSALYAAKRGGRNRTVAADPAPLSVAA